MLEPDPLAASRAYVAVRRWQDALRELGYAMRDAPESADALILVAICHVNLGDPQAALIAVSSAIAADPDNADAARIQSAVLVRLRKYREARSAADSAVRLAPQSVLAHLQRVDADTAQPRLTKAGLASADAALRLAPNEPQVHVALGNIESVRRRPARARQSYEQALRLDPENRSAQYALASLHQRTGAWSSATRLLLGLMRTDPSDPSYERMLRAALAGVLIIAALASAMATLFATPSKARPDPDLGQLAIVLGVCLAVQLGAVVWLRVVAGRNALRFLAKRGSWRGVMMIIAAVAIALADLTLIAALFVPASVAGTLAGSAMVLSFVGLLAVIASVGSRRV